MSKYDASLGEIKSQLPSVKNILIVLPSHVNSDSLASGLSLYLSLKQAGKEVSVVTEDTVRVSHTQFFAIDKVQNTLPEPSNGNFILSLEGVVTPDGQVPSLEKLDWYPEGANLNLVFHVLHGKEFKPTQVVPRYAQGSDNINLIFVLGAANWEDLGSIYQNHKDTFSQGLVVNIDNNISNSQYGKVNVVDGSAPSLSEITAQIIQSLGLMIDGDIATNLLAGVYEASSNLTSNKVTPETFMVVGGLMQAGGKIPTLSTPSTNQTPTFNEPQPPAQTDSGVFNNPQPQFPPLNQVFGFPVQEEKKPDNSVSTQSTDQNYTLPPVVATSDSSSNSASQSSAEERPMGEYAGSPNPEISNPDPNWLTPKIYKGGSAG